MTWQLITSAPKDRYILLFSPEEPRWAGNMEVGKWFGDDDEWACVWSRGGPKFTHWMELPDDP